MRKSTIAIGTVAGASLLTYLFDPDRGRSRRAKLADQLAAKARDAGESLRAQAKYQKGVLEGIAHEAASLFQEPKALDDETVLQKVRSEALGPADIDGSRIWIDVRDGHVSITGSLNDDEGKKRLLTLIERVEGVSSVDDLTSNQ
jgi:osmotically-inducible protein OsmY